MAETRNSPRLSVHANLKEQYEDPLQRVFNLKMGFGTRQHDVIPYRAMGPVTEEEYESRRERYDAQLVEHLNFDPKDKTTREKMQILRKYREEQFELLRNAIYERRGWDGNGIPTLKTLRRLQIDFPDVVALVKHG